MAGGLAIPEGDGGVLIEPRADSWGELAHESALRMRGVAGVSIAGEDLRSLRERSRGEALVLAREYSATIGIEDGGGPEADPGLVLMTGHQPALFHPGVWAKHLVLDSVASANGAPAIDLVVDTDGFDAVSLHAPCLRPDVRRCEVALAHGGDRGYYGGAPPPTAEEVGAFCAEGDSVLATLGEVGPRGHFRSYCEALGEASASCAELGAALTRARRRFESPLETAYLELSVVSQSRGSAFLTFAAELAVRAEEVAAVQNEELAAYRDRHGVRSSARPFPSLAEKDGSFELPLWHLHEGVRRSVWARADGDEVMVTADDDVVARLPRDPAGAAERLVAEAPALAPKALTLTLFNRLLVADLFVHGVGGAKYERVTDRVAERLFGVSLPPFAVVTMTLFLPLGERRVLEGELRAAQRRVHELTHNPDRHVEEIAAGDPERADDVRELAREKTRLVAEIASDGADKKALGARIREVNQRMATLASPVVQEAERELGELERARESEEIVRDRTYPFCLWDPFEVRDKLV